MDIGPMVGATAATVQNLLSPDYAGQAEAAENRRKQSINRGLQDINTVFYGGTLPTYADATGTFVKGQQYYIPDKRGGYKVWTTPSRSSYKGRVKQGLIYMPPTNQTFTGYGTNFYQGAADAYIKQAIPQLAQQYKTTGDAINYGLANRGLFGSGAQKKAQSDLNYTLGQQIQGVGDSAIAQARQVQQQVENARTNAINTLYSSADPAQGMASAISGASQISVPNSITPLTNAFSGLANQYLTNYLYNPPASSSQSNYNPYTSMFAQSLGPATY